MSASAYYHSTGFNILALLDRMAGLSEIELPINMVFFLDFLGTLMIIYRLTAAVSKMSQRIAELTQKMALPDMKAEQESEQ